jgi:hypothetical protein
LHPRNRSASGIEPQEISKKLVKLVSTGFNFTECHAAAAVERIPGQLGKTWEDINAELPRKSGDQLAPVEADSIRIFSITCGHTNQSLRAALWAIPSTEPAMSDGGKISAHKLGEEDVNFRQALEVGMPWLVIHHQVGTK